jgi:hypothetical protein
MNTRTDEGRKTRITVHAPLRPKNAIFAGSPARLVRAPKSWIATPQPTHTATAMTWRNNQSRYHVIAAECNWLAAVS